MKKFLLISLAIAISAMACTKRVESIDSAMLSSFKEVSVDTAKQHLLLSENLYKAAFDSADAVSFDTSCTYFVHSKGITNQKNSGRCWFFATTNILRHDLIDSLNLGDFEFSQTYGQFYDLLEKSNHFLENVIANRRRPMSSHMNEWLFRKPFSDGGHFLNAAYIIDKYGIVPQSVMPEVYSSTDNARLMREIRTLVRKEGLALRECPRRDIKEMKDSAMCHVYKMLVMMLGMPPSEFEYTMTDCNGNVLSTENYTPQCFKERYVCHDLLEDYVIVMNDPSRPFHKTYQVLTSRNAQEYPDWTFLNLPIEEIESLGVASLKCGDMFYFTCDTYQDSLQRRGIYDTRLFDVDSLLGVSTRMDKAQLIESGEITSAHAIAMAGVRLTDSSFEQEDESLTGQTCRPISWVVENSFGTSRGFGGYCVMSNRWFDRYMLRMAVLRKYLTPEQEAESHKKPRRIPAWNLSY